MQIYNLNILLHKSYYYTIINAAYFIHNKSRALNKCFMTSQKLNDQLALCKPRTDKTTPQGNRPPRQRNANNPVSKYTHRNHTASVSENNTMFIPFSWRLPPSWTLVRPFCRLLVARAAWQAGLWWFSAVETRPSTKNSTPVSKPTAEPKV